MAVFPEGAPCWVDVALPDIEAGKRFYGEIFGWTFRDLDHSRSDAFRDGKLAAALAAKTDGRMPTSWSVWFAAGDAARLADRITRAGGRLFVPPGGAGPAGAPGGSGPGDVVVVAADPSGAVFGLWQPGGGPGTPAGFEARDIPGSYCWAELYTWEKERSDPFYAEVFGYGATDLPRTSGELMDIRLWSPRGTGPGAATAVAGRCVLTVAFPAELPDHFLVYFSVADCDAAAADVVRLGGRVQAPPFDIPHGRIAVLMDNQGAVFAVLEEPER
ncbi:VOC family protein [Streptomyces sp. CAU 1734]|uniref:VOC family protein n=1 Tax=Streptomyces sp. CAU 1734 TaxID=3140360 RepID=UPI00326173B5